MTKAPERIWAMLNDSPLGPILQGTLSTEKSEVAAQVEYLRFDLSPSPKAFQQMREALLDATAHLVGAVSAYKTFAKRHRKFGSAETDVFYGTRLKDFDAAIDRARAALKAAEGK